MFELGRERDEGGGTGLNLREDLSVAGFLFLKVLLDWESG